MGGPLSLRVSVCIVPVSLVRSLMKRVEVLYVGVHRSVDDAAPFCGTEHFRVCEIVLVTVVEGGAGIIEDRQREVAGPYHGLRAGGVPKIIDHDHASVQRILTDREEAG